MRAERRVVAVVAGAGSGLGVVVAAGRAGTDGLAVAALEVWARSREGGGEGWRLRAPAKERRGSRAAPSFAGAR
ncbi:hypothetical protein BDY21DRAFT_115243 [Lineolata rhizophorae]|uniref:Uncharacterized protein n=1 Tax=Lineolata rhizophorae TaxID=578093 RepID=A0A6A6NQ55_9PEZI|nr:hypothetical protein BDY21DRAFT_115243 [Lineolata rhizophorae]